MIVREASCRCGQLRAKCTGEPFRISVCHCLDCQKRSGSAFAAQARWPDPDIEITGRYSCWESISDDDNKAVFRFCPLCGGTIAFSIEAMANVTAIPLGAFADPFFPPPHYSVYEDRKHSWVCVIGDHTEHYD